MEKPIEDVSLLEEADKWYCTKVQERKGTQNVLQSHNNHDAMLCKTLDREQEEDKEEDDDDNEEGQRCCLQRESELSQLLEMQQRVHRQHHHKQAPH